MDGRDVYVGSTALFAELGAPMDAVASDVEELARQAKTVVLVGGSDRVIGVLGIRDQIRPHAKEAIEALHAAGAKRVVMLTGDNPRTAAAIAGELGIDEVKAELRPEDKVAEVRALEERYGKLGMVGDGINDAPALAAASVGIAMGTAGTDAAIEAADVALMGDDLNGVAYALRLGRRAQRISRQNIVFSIALLAVLVPLAITGFLTVAIAVTAHEVAEIIAVGNGLRARTDAATS